VRGAALALALLLAGCGGDAPSDWLDEATLLELAGEQGDASGTTWSGSYALELATTRCDCPSVTVEGSAIDLCSLVELGAPTLELTHADGFAVAPFGEGMLSGPVDADGRVVLAGVQDISTLAGPLELLARVEGTLELAPPGALLRADAGQRLRGELGGDAIDCRWLGELVATRSD
jgi:hypothetical protein